MYTLRRISGDGVEMNKAIGDGYTVTFKDVSPDEFKRFLDSLEFGSLESVNMYAFVTADGGKYVQPLYSNQQNYIVSENGRTVSNLTHADLKHELKWGKKLDKESINKATKEVSFMYDQLAAYADDHLFPVSDIKRLINLAATGSADGNWATIIEEDEFKKAWS